MNNHFIINLTQNLLITEENKKKCRILKFTSDWTTDEIITEFYKLDGKIFKNLFIFEIKFIQDDKVKNLLNAARKFCKKRPLIIRLALKNNGKRKIFYICENSNEWTEVLEGKEENFKKFEDFSSFVRSFETKNYRNMSVILSDTGNLLKNPDQLTLRFLATLKPSSESRFLLLSHCAASYTKAQFLSALYIPFGSDERFLDEFQAKFIREIFTKEKKSILESAIRNENKEVLKYLISYCSHLIRQLPVPHQQKINAELIESNKLEILCDLLEFCDFVFPSDFNPQNFSHERLQKIIDKRQNFHNAIKNENYEEIHNFIKTSDLKLANNIQNKTALHTALSARKFEMYFHLVSLGFKSNDCEQLLESLENDKKFLKARDDSMKKNMKGSKSGDSMAINFLTARSKIFGKHSSEEHDKIRSWFEAISRIKQGRSLLNAASQCSQLMIIFDFESDDVERVDLHSPDADGIMYPGKKLVIVAAKHSTDEQEQKVKGVLAHELCHYVMRLVFENAEQPYLSKPDERFKIYNKIVDDLKYELSDEEKDDGCERIISSVFRLYQAKDFHAELIVRPIQILARYDNDELKVEQLTCRYKPLFDFWDTHLIPPMDVLDLRMREAVRKFNNSAGSTSYFLNKNLKFSVSKGIENLFEKNFVVARSNVPKLLFCNIFNQLRIKDGNLVDTRNIFISVKEFKDPKNNELKELTEEARDIKIFIDLSNGNQEIFNNLQQLPLSHFFFLTSNTNQSEELLKTLKEKLKVTEKFEEVELNYDWKDLAEITQNELLNPKINFQNNPNMTLGQLLENQQEIIDAELLNALLEDSKISINTTEEVEDHFHQLFRERKFVWNNQTISLKELLEETKNEKYVLISDVAGSGKSWAMKNISKELSRLNPTKWVTFMDLKQLIPAFKEQKQQPNFENFIVNEGLKEKSKFEVAIFKQKYRSGNSLIFFDGFDEITPESTTFVQELMKSFESNQNFRSTCNQLWISTRDFFEINLCEELEASFTCKLAEFTAEDGINLISNIWKLHDFRNQKELKSKLSNDKEIEAYKSLAREVCLKMSVMDLEGIGQPLIYKMLAEVTKNNKTKLTEGKFSSYKLFEEFWRISKKDWSQRKGEYRMKKDIESQTFDLNFLKVHQLKAMQKFMPEKLKYCDIDADNEEWKDEDIIGCGLMTKIVKNYFFIHETFSEFFVAQFIMRILSKPKVDTNVFEFIKEVVTNSKHEVIRMFLNESLASEKIQGKLKEKARKVATKVKSFKNPYEVFIKNLRNLDELGNFWFLVLKHWNYGKLVNVLTENIKNLVFMHETKITESSMKIFLDFFTSSVDVPTIKQVLTKLAGSTYSKIMQEVVNFKNNLGENIFFVLHKTKTITEKNFEKFIQILEEFLTEAEIAGKMMTCSSSGESLLHSCTERTNIQNLKTFWTGFEKILGAEKFKTLLMQKTAGLGQTILHHGAYWSKYVEFQEAFWSLLLKTFENHRDELKHFVLCQDVENNNFIYTMVQNNNSDVLKWSLNKLKSIFREDEVREFLKMKGFKNKNLLQEAALYSKPLKTHQVLWTFICELFSNKILKFVMETNDIGNDLLHYIMRYSSAEIFNFYIQELEKLASNDKIRKVLCSLNDAGRNILHIATFYNNNLELHESLWKTLRKYFNSSEILTFLSLHDYYGTTTTNYSSLYKTNEVIEFTQTEKDMEKIALNTDKKVHEESWRFLHEKYNKREIKEILLKKNIFGINFVHQVLRNENLEVIKNTFGNIQKVANLKEIFNSKDSNGQNLLQYSACEAVDFSVHKYLWQLLSACFSSDEIFKILDHTNKSGNNFMFHVAEFSSGDAAELTWNQIEQIDDQKLKTQINERNLRGWNVLHVCCYEGDCKKLRVFWIGIKKAFNSTKEFKDFVKQKDLNYQRTILHRIAISCKDVECHEILWNLLLRTFKDKNELKDFALSQNCAGSNFLFDLIRCNTSSDVIKFTFEICQKTFSPVQFNEILKSTGINDYNLLHQALRYTTNIKIHKILWEHLSGCENFMDVLASVDSIGWDLLNHAANYSTAIVLDFMCEELKKLNDKKQVKNIILSGRNFLHFAAVTNKNLDFHKGLWKLASTFLDTIEISHLVHWVDADGNNLLQVAVRWNTKEVVELTWMELTNFLNATEREDYLRNRNGEGLSLIGIATKYNQLAEIIDLVRSFIKITLNEAKETHESNIVKKSKCSIS